MTAEPVEGLAAQGVHPPMGQVRCEGPTKVHVERDSNGGRKIASTYKLQETARAIPSIVVRRVVHSTSSNHTSPGGGTLREQHDTLKEQTPVTHTSNSTILLSTNSSKSSPPYTLSQRKQLIVEKKII
jgi:hypothetical protein